jgi:hypothetical protein
MYIKGYVIWGSHSGEDWIPAESYIKQEVPWHNTGHIEHDAPNNSSIVTCVFITAVKFLPSRYLAMIGGYFTEPLPSNDKEDTQTHTHTQQRDLINLLLFFQNKESRLKISSYLRGDTLRLRPVNAV